jgi:C-terminal processing protease CtpA/Prc
VRPRLRSVAILLIAASCASSPPLTATTTSTTPFADPTTSTTIPPDPRVTNLAAYARLVNLVRFFHPSDRAAGTDWAAFISETHQPAAEAAPGDLAGILGDLFGPVAPTMRVVPEGGGLTTPPELVDAPPDAQIVGWRHRGVGIDQAYDSGATSERAFYAIGEEPRSPSEPLRLYLGAGVDVLLPITLFAVNGKTIPTVDGPDPWPSGPGRLLEWSDARSESEATRVTAVILAWGMFEHFYPYWTRVAGDWDQALSDGLERAINEPAMPLVEVLRRLVAAADDGHAEVFPAFEGLGAPPIRWEMVEGRLTVTYLTGGQGDIRLGDEVLTIDGDPVADAIAATEPLVSASTESYRVTKALFRLLLGPWGTDMALTVRGATGEPRTVLLRRTAVGSLFPISEPRPGMIAMVAPGILYIDLTQVTTYDLSAARDDIDAARGLILDMRGYPASAGDGTSAVWDILPRLITEPVRSDVFEWPIRTGPGDGYLTYEDVTWTMDPAMPHIDAKVAVLIDDRAISASETFLGIVEQYHLAELVGSPTAGTNGNNLAFFVPGNITIGMTGLRVTNQDGTPHHGVGVLPTLPVNRTIAGVRAGQDEILQAAIDALIQELGDT